MNKVALINDCIPLGTCSSYKIPTNEGIIKGTIRLNFGLKKRICIKNELEKNYNITVFSSSARTVNIGYEPKLKQIPIVKFIVENNLTEFDTIIIFMPARDFSRYKKKVDILGDINIPNKETIYGAYKVILDELKGKYSDKNIIFVSPAYLKDGSDLDGKQYLKVIKDEIIKYGFNYISFYEFLLEKNRNIGYLFPDKIHPSIDCQVIMTEYVTNEIRKIIEKTEKNFSIQQEK